MGEYLRQKNYIINKINDILSKALSNGLITSDKYNELASKFILVQKDEVTTFENAEDKFRKAMNMPEINREADYDLLVRLHKFYDEKLLVYEYLINLKNLNVESNLEKLDEKYNEYRELCTKIMQLTKDDVSKYIYSQLYNLVLAEITYYDENTYLDALSEEEVYGISRYMLLTLDKEKYKNIIDILKSDVINKEKLFELLDNIAVKKRNIEKFNIEKIEEVEPNKKMSLLSKLKEYFQKKEDIPIDGELTLLTEDQVEKSEIFKKYGKSAAITDFAILLGGYVRYVDFFPSKGETLEDRRCYYWTKESGVAGIAQLVYYDGSLHHGNANRRDGAVRPVLLSSSIIHSTNGVRSESGITEVQYGEYPQQAVSENLSRTLEDEYQFKRLKRTGKTYTTDSRQVGEHDKDFKAQQHEEFEYNGKKYVRVIANLDCGPTVISNREKIKTGDTVWVEVEPITWLIDEQKNFAVSKNGIVGGIRFYNSRCYWNGDFYNTEMNMFLQNYLKKDMFRVSKVLDTQIDESIVEKER